MNHATVSGKEGTGDERRVAPRHEYGLVQQMAEMVDGHVPAADTFTRVQIVDLSRDGFAYYTLSRPECDQVVVVIGDPPNLECLRARIVYARPIEEHGHVFHRVGCQFTGIAEVDVQAIIRQQLATTDAMLGQLNDLSCMGQQDDRD